MENLLTIYRVNWFFDAYLYRMRTTASGVGIVVAIYDDVELDD